MSSKYIKGWLVFVAFIIFFKKMQKGEKKKDGLLANIYKGKKVGHVLHSFFKIIFPLA